MTGAAGGPFTNTRVDLKLGNRSHQPLDWTARAPSYVQLSPNSGTIDARTRIPLSATLDTSVAGGLAAGRYTDSITFHNETSNEADIVVPLTLVIDAGTVSGLVTPATDFNSQGTAGGPFSPDSVVYTLTNTGTIDLPWQASAADSWVTASPSSGQVPVGGSVNVTVAIQDPATGSLSNGLHPSSVTFTETSGNTTLATRLVSLNVQSGQQSSGWTTFTPSADTRILYVSSSTGNDANDGYSPSTPKRTLAAARAAMRNGYPDWMLLRCGDSWNENFGGGFGLSGRSPTERMLVSSYGTGPRPTILSGAGNAFAVWGNAGDGCNLAVVGLHLWPNTYDGINGTPRGICVFGSAHDLLIEDCYIQACETNIVFQSAKEFPDGNPSGRLQNIALRRNVIVDAYNTGGTNSEGLYAQGIDGFLVEENIFDRNGWRDDVAGSYPTWFRRNIYIQNGNTGVVLHGNILARTDGMQIRCGGTIEENLLMKNAISILCGGGETPEPGGVTGNVNHNVILDGNDLQAGNPRGWGINFENIKTASANQNVIAHNVNGHAPYPVTFGVADNGAGIQSLAFSNNIVFDWNGSSRFTGSLAQTQHVELTGNKFQNEITSDALIVHNNPDSVNGVWSSNNVFNSIASFSTWMEAGNGLSLNQWKPLVHDTTSVAQDVSFPDPNRTIATYSASIGGQPSLDAFMMESRNQSKAYWRIEYTAQAVNDYIRAGYGL